MGDRDFSTRETFAAKEGQEKPTASQSSPSAAVSGFISGEIGILDHSQFPTIPPSRSFLQPAVPSTPPPSRNWPRSFSSLLRTPLRTSNPRPVPVSASTKVAVSPPTASSSAEKAMVEPTTSTKGQSPATALAGIDKVTDDSNSGAKESPPVASTTEMPPAVSTELRYAERGIDLNLFLNLPLNGRLQLRQQDGVSANRDDIVVECC
ncbi:hypothetical protein HPP92_023620 [Vanilla planifolia]|uniref:Uncharacterized protein n=1 Tax=Vanilla planifolia TaxID=51239 RepID=A0A835PWH0_VANPL|nr:hypothetical protein HPP92_023620 [Vanilla planifolia]